MGERFVNLTPGEIVPKSGTYKCNVCMLGGLVDVTLKALIKKGAIKNIKVAPDFDWGNTEAIRAVRNAFIAGGISSGVFRGDLADLKRQIEGREIMHFFNEGEKFIECPNCGESTGWTLLELTPDLARKYKEL